MGMMRRIVGFDFNLRDLDMPETILEKTEIPGLYWVQNDYVKTGERSRIVMQSLGQMYSNIVWHGAEENGFEYKVYGIHVGQVDRLTFINGQSITGKFVDCRKGSPTLHKALEIHFDGSPDRKLVIDRGIAHWFGNLTGVVTRNEPALYWGIGNPDFDSASDTLNVHRDAPLDTFPTVQVNPYQIPQVFTSTVLLMQRLRIRKGQNNYPFRFKIDGKFLKIRENYGNG